MKDIIMLQQEFLKVAQPNLKALSQRKVQKARAFATGAHMALGQLRKYTNEPYIVHPHQVAWIVSAFDETPEILMAAYLHDVAEDTRITLDQIGAFFGPVVRQYVYELTDISKPEDGNRFMRKQIDSIHSSQASAQGQTVKCADIYSNIVSIFEHDKKFAKVYLPEKQNQLTLLTKAHPVLQSHVLEVCNNYIDELAAEKSFTKK